MDESDRQQNERDYDTQYSNGSRAYARGVACVCLRV